MLALNGNVVYQINASKTCDPTLTQAYLCVMVKLKKSSYSLKLMFLYSNMEGLSLSVHTKYWSGRRLATQNNAWEV